MTGDSGIEKDSIDSVDNVDNAPLCLIFKQQEGGKEVIAFACPHTDEFTIGRGGHNDIVPIVGGLSISRLHATVSRREGHWTVVDGGLTGNTYKPSNNGIFKPPVDGVFDAARDRIVRVDLVAVGDYADLLPPQNGLLARIVCEAECDRPQLYSRETDSFDDYWRQKVSQDISEIRTGQAEQRELFDRFVKRVERVNRRQDAFIKGLCVGLLILVVGLGADSSKQEDYIDLVAKLMVAIVGTGATTIVLNKGQDESQDKD
ncbi:MAG: FHA domain-containing protein [Microcoleus sp.]